MEEIWEKIPGYNGLYLISNKGKVKSLHRKNPILLKQSIDTGYSRVTLTINYKTEIFRVHRIVASVFIPNPENKPQVNHIDGNKLNNDIKNLEWCTNAENQIHAYKIGINKNRKLSIEHKEKMHSKIKRKVKNIDTGEIYESISDAALKNGIKISTLIHYLLGTRKNKTNLEYL